MSTPQPPRLHPHLHQRLEALEPGLRQTCWPPMTYMLIPSLRRDALRLIRDMERALREAPDEPLERALAHLRQLVADFHREL